MKKLLLSMLLCILSMGVAAQSMYGDVNGDNVVNITDVNHVINIILIGVYGSGADVNNDGQVNITDLNVIIELILTPPVEPPVEEGNWVDLGLPSGTIWATRNIGASAPEDYGSFFAWGETSSKEVYNWDTYKWYNSHNNHSGLTKYCTQSSYGYNGFTDGKTELDPADDAATANWGSVARMPSLEQIQELVNNCTWKWTNGQLGTGPNGNTIFLPAAGYRFSGSPYGGGSGGCYWSRTLRSDNSYGAYYLNFSSNGVGWGNIHYRLYGRTVRAVRISED